MVAAAEGQEKKIHDHRIITNFLVHKKRLSIYLILYMEEIRYVEEDSSSEQYKIISWDIQAMEIPEVG